MKKRNNARRFIAFLLCEVILMGLMPLTVFADGDYITIEWDKEDEEKSQLNVSADRYDNYTIDNEKSIELWQTTSNTSAVYDAECNLVAYCLPTYDGDGSNRKLKTLEIIVSSSKTVGGVERDKEIRISDEEDSVKAVLQEIGKHKLYFPTRGISLPPWQVNPEADVEINVSGYMELLEYAFENKDNIYGPSSDASFFNASFILDAFGTDVALNEDTVFSTTPQPVFNNVNLMNMVVWLDDEGRVQLSIEGCDVDCNTFLNELTNLYNELQSVEASILASTQPTVLALIKYIGGAQAKILEEKQQEEQNRADSLQNIQAESTYDGYMKLLLQHLYSDSTDDSVLEKLKSFPSQIGDLRDLDAEEEMRLRVLADIIGAQYPERYSELVGGQSEWKWNVSENNLSSIIISQRSTWNTATIESALQTEQDRIGNNGQVLNQRLPEIMQNAYAIALYNALKMYGSNLDSSAYDYLESLTIKQGQEIKDVILSASATSTVEGGEVYKAIPEMSKLSGITASVEAYNAYYNLQYLLVLISTYATDFANGEVSQLLNDFCENYNSLDGIPDEEWNKVSPYIIACHEIKEALNFLGVETWTDDIRLLLNYANRTSMYVDYVKNNVISYEQNEQEALHNFFNLSNKTFSEDYLIGVTLSATFKPLVTNMYDVSSVAMVEDTEWVSRFHYPFGFYRKALYIETDENAAVNKYVKGSGKGTTRIATLKDLMEPEKDIVLYIDDKFYNIDELAKTQGYTYTKLQNAASTVEGETNEGFFDSIASWWAEINDQDIEAIAKTGGNTVYSRNIQRKAAAYKSGDKDKADSYILSDKDIDKYLTGYTTSADDEYQDSYTPLQSFAVVSAIYRDKALYSAIRSEVGKPSPVFVSSASLPGVTNVNDRGFSSVYNYMMLKNLESAAGIDYKTQLDLNAALYMDIYGNILTDSGLVVIPALSNATLCNDKSYSPATAGFIYLYSQGVYEVPYDFNNTQDKMNSLLQIDNNTKTWVLGTKVVSNIRINFQNLPLNDIGVLNTLKRIAVDNVTGKNYLPFKQRVYIITEVLRGAPLDRIDKDFEKITTGVEYNKYTIAIALKLESLVKSFVQDTSSVSILSLPNLAFMDGVEYVILFLFKLIFVALFLLFIYRMYMDAVQGMLGLKAVFSFIMSVVMFLVTAFSIPTLLDLSYYQVNKRLLQNEAEYIALLNMEKKAEGREIGIDSVTSVGTNTKLYLKVDDMSIPWYEILDDVLVGSTFNTISAVYEAEFDKSPLANLPRFVKKGENLYISIDDIFANSSIEFDPETKTLYTVVKSTPYESYVTPYYAILDVLISRINYYNEQNQYTDFNTKVVSGGRIRTMGLITKYLVSEEYMFNSQDPAGLKAIYELPTTAIETQPFTEEQFAAMKQSAWYSEGDIDDIEEKLDKVAVEARHFVDSNRNLLGKVTDETFLKVMALELACKHNSMMRIGSGSSIEIYEVDMTDIIRLSIADRTTVTSQSSKSFVRFIYDNMGGLGVIVIAFLILVYLIGALLKPICLAIIIACMVYAVAIRRVVKRDTESAYEGFLITLAVICGVNIMYSLIMKASMSLPALDLGMTVSAIIQLVIQIIYLVFLVGMTAFVFRNSTDLGAAEYERVLGSIGFHLKDISVGVHDASGKRLFSNSEDDASAKVSVPVEVKNEKGSLRKESRDLEERIDRTNGTTIYESMRAADKSRKRHAGRK